MPQVFSPGWLFLFLFVMAIYITRIFMKLRDIRREPDMTRPVLPVAPLRKGPSQFEKEGSMEDVLEGPDRLIREGSYGEAVDALASQLEGLSPVEDRALVGKIQYRLGASWRLIGVREGQSANLLRSGAALREAVSLFSPPRLRSLQVGALAELAGLYEDLAPYQSPVENLTLSIRNWGSAATASRASGLILQEAVFRSRSGTALRLLAMATDRQRNLVKAINAYETAVAVPGAFDDKNALFEKAKILKMLGDTRLELSKVLDKDENLRKTVSEYDKALEIMTVGEHPEERFATLLDTGRVLLNLYDVEKNPVLLKKAFHYLREALDLVKMKPGTAGKGAAMALMGDAFLRYSEVKDRPENLERAIRLYETSLGFLKEPEYAPHRDRIKEGLRQAVERMDIVRSRK